jgi:hypothetical protein
MSKYSVEIVRQIWDDEHGERVEVGPDADGLGLVSLCWKDANGKRIPRETITLTPDMALLVAEQLRIAATEAQGGKE